MCRCNPTIIETTMMKSDPKSTRYAAHRRSITIVQVANMSDNACKLKPGSLPSAKTSFDMENSRPRGIYYDARAVRDAAKFVSHAYAQCARPGRERSTFLRLSSWLRPGGVIIITGNPAGGTDNRSSK
jgi:hypothetical protein